MNKTLYQRENRAERYAMSALGLSWPGFTLLLQQSIENDELINKLLSIRSDLNKEIILVEVSLLQQKTINNFRHWLNICIIRAMKGDSLPWE